MKKKYKETKGRKRRWEIRRGGGEEVGEEKDKVEGVWGNEEKEVMENNREKVKKWNLELDKKEGKELKGEKKGDVEGA